MSSHCGCFILFHPRHCSTGVPGRGTAPPAPRRSHRDRWLPAAAVHGAGSGWRSWPNRRCRCYEKNGCGWHLAKTGSWKIRWNTIMSVTVARSPWPQTEWQTISYYNILYQFISYNHHIIIYNHITAWNIQFSKFIISSSSFLIRLDKLEHKLPAAWYDACAGSPGCRWPTWPWNCPRSSRVWWVCESLLSSGTFCGLFMLIQDSTWTNIQLLMVWFSRHSVPVEAFPRFFALTSFNFSKWLNYVKLTGYWGRHFDFQQLSESPGHILR